MEKVKAKNAEQVQLFEEWAEKKDWKTFKPEHSHYDWWAFPITKSSASYGDEYALNAMEIQYLKRDKEFMRHYRKGVELVVKSWGWDLRKNAPVPKKERTADQLWTGYGVRLGKMADSLKLFGEKDKYRRLQRFFDKVCVPLGKDKHPLEAWVYTHLGRHPPKQD